eukprot:scaffold1712_cov261-Pinguiococcus_pyrenoidosus.AAC.18
MTSSAKSCSVFVGWRQSGEAVSTPDILRGARLWRRTYHDYIELDEQLLLDRFVVRPARDRELDEDRAHGDSQTEEHNEPVSYDEPLDAFQLLQVHRRVLPADTGELGTDGSRLLAQDA